MSMQTSMAGPHQKDGRTPKDLLYGDVASGKRTVGHFHLCYTDCYKRNVVDRKIDSKTWEQTAEDRSSWCCLLCQKLHLGEEKIHSQAAERRCNRKEQASQSHPETKHCYSHCNRDCHSCIRLISQRQCCSRCSEIN